MRSKKKIERQLETKWKGEQNNFKSIGHRKSSTRRGSTAMQAHLKKEKKISNEQSTLHLKEVEKE